MNLRRSLLAACLVVASALTVSATEDAEPGVAVLGKKNEKRARRLNGCVFAPRSLAACPSRLQCRASR